MAKTHHAETKPKSRSIPHEGEIILQKGGWRNLLTSHTVTFRCQNHFKLINRHKSESVGSPELETHSQIMGNLIYIEILSIIDMRIQG